MPRLNVTGASWILILAVALAAPASWEAFGGNRASPDRRSFFSPIVLVTRCWAKRLQSARRMSWAPTSACFARRLSAAAGRLVSLVGHRRAGDFRRGCSAPLGTLAVAVVGWWTTRLFNARRDVGRAGSPRSIPVRYRWACSCSARARSARSCCSSWRCGDWRCGPCQAPRRLALACAAGLGRRSGDAHPAELAVVHAAGVARLAGVWIDVGGDNWDRRRWP